MKNNYLFLFLCFISFCATYGQEVQRVLVSGELTASEGESVEGINIYNISSEKGTVSNEKGEFTIEIGENDHVLFSALQFKDFIVMISEKDVLARHLKIRLDQAVNSLDEVIVRSTDLSGILAEDVRNIKTTTLDGEQFDMSYEALQYDYDFNQDYKSVVDGNAAETAINSGGMKNGFNPLGFVDLLFPKKKKSPKNKNKELGTFSEVLKDRYETSFYVINFKIPESKVSGFLYFVEEQITDRSLLSLENELNLLNQLKQLSDTYKAKLQ
ncbi:MAG: carboxypeptidase-like regulatory domain-containing protein [Bacteroidetes bacterium]|nr:carboxypeptidase-like regulatory domain-containing protein [Bacteroidota bacterium]